jgi:hypothetical protein
MLGSSDAIKTILLDRDERDLFVIDGKCTIRVLDLTLGQYLRPYPRQSHMMMYENQMIVHMADYKWLVYADDKGLGGVGMSGNKMCTRFGAVGEGKKVKS